MAGENKYSRFIFNYGHTDFINCSIQALLHTIGITTTLYTLGVDNFQELTGMVLTFSFYELFKRLINNEDDKNNDYGVRNFIRIFQTLQTSIQDIDASNINYHVNQDVQEFLLEFFIQLDMENKSNSICRNVLIEIENKIKCTDNCIQTRSFHETLYMFKIRLPGLKEFQSYNLRELLLNMAQTVCIFLYIFFNKFINIHFLFLHLGF